MKINIKGIKVFKSLIFYDNRGSFKEVYKKKLLPNKNLNDLLFLDKLNKNRFLRNDEWGVMVNGTVAIEKNEEGKIYKNIVRHEIFHRIFDYIIQNLLL